MKTMHLVPLMFDKVYALMKFGTESRHDDHKAQHRLCHVSEGIEQGQTNFREQNGATCHHNEQRH